MALASSRPRFAAGVVAGLVFCAAVFWSTGNLLLSFFIPSIWGLGLLLGGKLALVGWYFRRDRDGPPNAALQWSSAFWVSLAATAAASYALGRSSAPLLLVAMTGPFALCYGLSKLGCLRFGCCNWSAPAARNHPVGRLPLPASEAALSLTLAGTLFCAVAAGARPAWILAAFLLGHGLTRLVHRWGRQRAPSLPALLLSTDTAPLLLLGVSTLALGVAGLL